jgi:hypothetical protein
MPRLKKSERSHPQIRPLEMPWLIVIWMTVAPVPVIVLIRMFPMLVGKISLVASVLVGPVCVVLAVVPVVIVVVPRVVDTDLDMFIVGRCSGKSGAACRKGSPDRNPWNLNFEITVDIIVRITRLQSCPLQHTFRRPFT